MAENAEHHCFGIKQGKVSFWVRSFETGRKASTNSETKPKGCTILTKELC
jgi:hypothetical protein